MVAGADPGIRLHRGGHIKRSQPAFVPDLHPSSLAHQPAHSPSRKRAVSALITPVGGVRPTIRMVPRQQSVLLTPRSFWMALGAYPAQVRTLDPPSRLQSRGKSGCPLPPVREAAASPGVPRHLPLPGRAHLASCWGRICLPIPRTRGMSRGCQAAIRWAVESARAKSRNRLMRPPTPTRQIPNHPGSAR